MSRDDHRLHFGHGITHVPVCGADPSCKMTEDKLVLTRALDACQSCLRRITPKAKPKKAV